MKPTVGCICTWAGGDPTAIFEIVSIVGDDVRYRYLNPNRRVVFTLHVISLEKHITVLRYPDNEIFNELIDQYYALQP